MNNKVNVEIVTIGEVISTLNHANKPPKGTLKL